MKTVKNYLIASVLLLLLATMESCESGMIGIRGEGEMVEQTLNLDDFYSLSSEISANVHITYGAEKSVKIVGQQNIIDNISTTVKSGYWEVKFNHRVRKHDGLDIYITTNDLESIELSGSGDLVSTNKFVSTRAVDYSISGSGNIDFDIDAPKVSAAISGSGDIRLNTSTPKVELIISGSGNSYLNGQSEALDITISGSGNIYAYSLETIECNVNVSGTGNCELFVANSLSIDISGSGDINYKGYPSISTHISGSGNIRNRN